MSLISHPFNIIAKASDPSLKSKLLINMKRVSSRQRLVSWDAFEASREEGSGSSVASSTSEADALENDLSLLTIQRTKSHDSSCSLKRKRAQRAKNLSTPSAIAVMIPTEDTETLLMGMSDDVKLRIASFLDPDDVRRLMQSSKEFHHLFSSEESNLLWRQFCQDQWMFCEVTKTEYISQIPMTSSRPLQSDSQEMHDQYKGNALNWNALLQFSTESWPSFVDESIFASCRWSRSLRRYRLRTTPQAVELKTVPLSEGKIAVQFTGHVGTGDRCIRANEPFALPQERVQAPKGNFRGPLTKLFRGRGHQHDPNSSSLLDRLKRGKGKGKSAPAPLLWKPFVVPYCYSNNTEKMKMSLTPRLVHYYEVKILEAPEQRPVRPQFGEDEPPRSSECVAVGLSTNQFSLHTRMPGWCTHSFGYHGDDGGVFHSTGHMLREFGPTFGCGDTVGCGLDYHRSCIFFTLNGEFLGDAFKGLGRLECADFHDFEWYPTVGIDTKCLVQCNFGTDEAFQFDLERYIEKHQLQSMQAAMEG